MNRRQAIAAMGGALAGCSQSRPPVPTPQEPKPEPKEPTPMESQILEGWYVQYMDTVNRTFDKDGEWMVLVDKRTGMTKAGLFLRTNGWQLHEEISVAGFGCWDWLNDRYIYCDPGGRLMDNGGEVLLDPCPFKRISVGADGTVWGNDADDRGEVATNIWSWDGKGEPRIVFNAEFGYRNPVASRYGPHLMMRVIRGGVNVGRVIVDTKTGRVIGHLPKSHYAAGRDGYCRGSGSGAWYPLDAIAEGKTQLSAVVDGKVQPLAKGGDYDLSFRGIGDPCAGIVNGKQFVGGVQKDGSAILLALYPNPGAWISDAGTFPDADPNPVLSPAGTFVANTDAGAVVMETGL